jgi:hypothetical protein
VLHSVLSPSLPAVLLSEEEEESITLAFWYSPTRLSKKFVFPSREIRSIQGNGLLTLYFLPCPRETRSLHWRDGEGRDGVVRVRLVSEREGSQV